MIFNDVYISAIEHYLPELILTSDEIESKLSPLYDKLRLPEGRLELMTGIKERRYWEKGTKPSDLSTKAALKLLENNKISKNDIDLVIHTSVCRDFLEPSTASVVHSNLGLGSNCTFFDLSNACLGLMSAINVVAPMIEKGSIKHALLVSGENGGPLLLDTIEHLLNDPSITRKNIKKYIANLTIGSGAVAYLISHKKFITQGHQVLGGGQLSDSSANKLCQGSGDTTSLMMETNSEQLLEHGILLAKKTWELTKNNLKLENENFDYVVGHQVGSAHEKLTMEAMGLQNHKTYTTYQYLGNTGSAALPITVSIMKEKNILKEGQILGMLGIGSGLSSSMLGVKW